MIVISALYFPAPHLLAGRSPVSSLHIALDTGVDPGVDFPGDDVLEGLGDGGAGAGPLQYNNGELALAN